MESMDFSRKLPRVKWNEDKRIFLCCLCRFFKRDNHAFEEIFNNRYKKDLKGFGFQEGPSYNTLTTQWADMKRHGDPVWGRVHLSPFDRNGRWQPVIEEIRNVAESLRITLVLKDTDDIDVSDYQPITPTKLTAASTVDLSSPPSIFPSSPNPRSQPRAEPAQCLTEFGGKVCWWCLDQGSRPDECELPARGPSPNEELPPLLYRWSNADSQGINTPKRFVSGLFADSEVTPFLPEQIHKEEFDNYVLNHVSIAKHESPFISTFQSILAPIHRAMWGMEGARVSIIDTRKLRTPVYFAKDLVRRNGICIRGYLGGGEYLIWHEVPSPAIICSFKITTLRQLARDNEDINRVLQLDKIASYKRVRGPLRAVLSREPGSMNLDLSSGKSIGRLLRMINVPQEYYQMVGEGMLKSWQLQKEGTWQEFFEGMEVGFSSSPTQSPRHMDRTGEVWMTDEVVERITEVDDNEEDGPQTDEDEDDGNDPEVDTPCPPSNSPIVRTMPILMSPQSRPTATNCVQLYNPDTRNWSPVGESSSPMEVESPSFSKSNVIVLDEVDEELEELGDLVMEDEFLDAIELPSPPKDTFAADRERIRRLLE